jgi:hypothetical protein
MVQGGFDVTRYYIKQYYAKIKNIIIAGQNLVKLLISKNQIFTPTHFPPSISSRFQFVAYNKYLFIHEYLAT